MRNKRIDLCQDLLQQLDGHLSVAKREDLLEELRENVELLKYHDYLKSLKKDPVRKVKSNVKK